MMTYPGGVFHCSLGLMGEGSQPRYVCVCVYICLQYMMVCLPQALCCVAVMLSVTLLRPEPCSQRNQLWNWQVCLLHSPTLFLPLQTHTHTHTCNHIHIMRHTRRHTQSSMAWGLSTHAHTSPPPPHIHTYPETITQAAGSLSHASYKHSAKGICLQSSDIWWQLITWTHFYNLIEISKNIEYPNGTLFRPCFPTVSPHHLNTKPCHINIQIALFCC